MKNIKDYDPSYSPSELFEVDEHPDCSNCCDTGTVYAESGIEEFCECASGQAAQDNFESHDHDFEGGLFEDDADALASMGWGTDEDYGYYGGEDY